MNHINWHILGKVTHFAILPERRVDDGAHIFCYSFYFLKALLSIEFSQAIHTGYFLGGFQTLIRGIITSPLSPTKSQVPCSHTHISNYRPREDWTLCQKLVLKDIIILSQLAQTLLYSKL